MTRQRKVLVILACCILASCQPTSLEEFQCEGDSLGRKLLSDLRKIEARQDLAFIEPVLKKDFESLVKLIIDARMFQQKNMDADLFLIQPNAFLNASLKEELQRVYAIEGGREVVERAQKEAMLALHAKEQMLEKKSQRFN